MRAIAGIAERFGSGAIRLTAWQNLLVSDIAEKDRKAVAAAVSAAGLHTEVSRIRAGIVACTGNSGCKFSASDTKRHALAIADHLDAHVKLETPLNIHLTGCPHSCAQHYIGDLGLLATKIVTDDAEVEGYHVYAGGGFGDRRTLGREILHDVPADQVPVALERLLQAFIEQRASPAEEFHEFAKRQDDAALRALAQPKLAAAA
jgi:ferredoxin-nitrite reductase